MPNTDPSDIDPLADLDDDLGDDWESAFQSEDFMFTPDEEANDFFLFDENDSEEEIDDLTAIMDDAEKEVSQEQQAAKELEESEKAETKPSPPLKALLEQLQQKIAPVLIFFKARPLYQRALAISVPCLALTLLIGLFFLRTTTEELSQTEEMPTTMAEINVGPQQDLTPPVEPITQKPQPTLAPEPDPEPSITKKRTIRKQWDFPTFTIVSSTPKTETLFVNVNLSLIAILPEGGALPEEKNVWVKDIIYQFYQNRSPHELKRFALARGEMIHKLHAWLKKEWPGSPINTVIFSKYQVVRTPQSS